MTLPTIPVALSLNGKSQLADEITTLLSKAAAAILAFDPASITRSVKLDHSPVTAADDAAQSVIVDGLTRLLPGVSIISEEMDRRCIRFSPGDLFLLVDPLDGTREYLAGRNEYTVNVSIVLGGVPLFGCIVAPALGTAWRGLAGERAERLELPPGAEAGACRHKASLRTRPLHTARPVIAVSRSHLDAQTEEFAARFPSAERIACGSSLKFCRIAEGQVDLYPRLAPTHEWDIAAGHAIVSAAGGDVTAPDGKPLTYGRAGADFRVDGFVAFGDVGVVPTLLPG
jgi:3'(2'), 5'-bisphosphate nucleotidase